MLLNLATRMSQRLLFVLLAPDLSLFEATHNVTKFSYQKVIVGVINS